MTQRRLVVLTITATPEELRYIASCIEVGNEGSGAEVFELDQADAMVSKLRRIAGGIESGRGDLGDYMIPYIQEGVAQGSESL